MCRMSSTADPVALSIEADFVELVYNDSDLLMAEFEEIVADEWGPCPPDGEPASAAALGGPGHSHPAPALIRDLLRPRHPGLGERARQRSPPIARKLHDERHV